MVLQILVNLIFAAGFVVVWIRLNKPAKDDPRLSRGLQLLQSKIAILEDLSDQVERQVQQVVQLMEIKAKDLQAEVSHAEDQIRQIEVTTSKSLEVAKIFQDRIPHEEFVDRKATLKYIKAARLANQGVSIDDIAEQVDLSRGEIEFVAKVNRDHLQFSDADLPEWAKQNSLDSAISPLSDPRIDLQATTAPVATVIESQPLMRFTDHASPTPPTPHPGGGTGHGADTRSLNSLGSRFRQALDTRTDLSSGMVPQLEFHLSDDDHRGSGKSSSASREPVGNKSQVKKVIFPRIDKPLF